MITIKTDADLQRMDAAGRVVEETLRLLKTLARPGVTTAELDHEAERFIRSRGATPSFLHYHGYPKSICTSVNEQVVHGIPGPYRLKDGDILSVDVGACLDGFQGDAARTFLIGNVPEEVRSLVRVTRESFFAGLRYARAGNRIGDISAAIQAHAEAHGYGVVREMIGHGIGREMHEDPEVPNFGRPGHGPRLVEGMTLAIEPMINLKGDGVKVMPDGWTTKTVSGSVAAHFEHSIAITADGPVILSKRK